MMFGGSPFSNCLETVLGIMLTGCARKAVVDEPGICVLHTSMYRGSIGI